MTEVLFMGAWGRVAGAIAVVAAVAIVAMAALAYRRLPRRRSRAGLLALRGAAVGGALVLFFQPAIDLARVKRGRNRVAVIVDDSRSMALRDEPGGPTRLEQARGALAAAHATFEGWRRERDVDFFTFSDSIEAASEETAGTRPRADATRLGEAIDALAHRYAGRDLGAVVIVSDGADNGRLGRALDEAARRQLRALDAPVHGVALGRPGLRDVSVTALASDDFAFVRTVFRLEVVVRATGYDGVTADVSLRREGAVVQTRAVQLRSGEQRVSFDVVPDRPGEAYFEVAVPVQPDEAIAQNNVRGFVLRAVRDRVRVLHVAGRPDFDVLFLRRFLKRNPNVDLVSFFILRTPTDLQLVPSDELSLIPFPTRELFEEEMGSFDAAILQNFDFAPYGMEPYLPRLREFVEGGGGLAMVGGSLGFAGGGWAGTVVGEVLPVSLPVAAVDPARLWSEGEFRPRVIEEAADHPLMRVGATRAEGDRVWRRLPPLGGANLVGGARDGATVLAAHPTLRTPEGEPMPVVAVREVGKGRTLAVATGSTWRWAFVDALAGGDGRAYERFWDNAIRWLIHDPDLRRVRVEVAKPAFVEGEPVRVTARVFSLDYRPAAGVSVSASWRRLGDELVQALPPRATDANGEATWDVRPEAQGAHRVAASATLDGATHADEKTFVVEPRLREMEDPQARPDLLRAIARETGGSFLEGGGGGGGSWAALAVRPARVTAIEGRRQVELWSGPWMLAFVVAALGAEWALRRRWGFA